MTGKVIANTLRNFPTGEYQNFFINFHVFYELKGL